MLRVVGVAAVYKVRPSEIMGIEDPYTAYCLDEACAFIHTKLQKGEEPILPQEEENTEPVHYSSPSEFYKKFDN